MNPLVNPGAISATSMVTGSTSDAVWQKISGFHNAAAGRQLTVLQDVYKSESDTNQRNQAIGALMLAYGYIKGNWEQAVDLYTRQCSIGVNTKDLATMAATLAAGGRNPVTGNQVLDAAKVPSVLAVMSTAGLYDDSGKWLYHTGLPAKSGVGGGIIAVSPGKFGIAVISPPLDDAGNSVRAQRAIADISAALGGNPYGRSPAPTAPAPAPAQAPAGAKPTFEIYGFAMLDIGHDFKQINPNWSDTMRVTKLPSVADQFGHDNSTFAGVRQSRLGVRSSTPTALGELKTTFEFELFGTGVDEGQTTFRLRHAYGELGAFGAGQDLEPVHGPGRLPELARVLGPHRDGLLPQRAGPLDADQGRQQPDAGPRASRRQRRPGHLLGPHRGAEHQGPLPAARLLRILQVRAEVGLRARRRHAPGDQVGRRARRSVRPLRRRHRLGPEPELESQPRQERRPPLPVRVRRGHPELHERFAGGHRHRQRPLEPRDTHSR